MVEVLPAPFGPRKPKHCCRRTTKSMSLTATNEPYDFVSPRACTTMLSFDLKVAFGARRGLAAPRSQHRGGSAQGRHVRSPATGEHLPATRARARDAEDSHHPPV